MSTGDLSQEEADAVIQRCLARLADAEHLPLDPPFGAMDQLVELLQEVSAWADDVWITKRGLSSVYAAINEVARRWERRWRLRRAELSIELLRQDMTSAIARCLEVVA